MIDINFLRENTSQAVEKLSLRGFHFNSKLFLELEEERKKISNQLFDEKTLLIYKDLFKLNQKSISYDDFVKLATEK